MSKVILLALMAVCSYAATVTGEISDSACGASHAKMLAEHKNMKTDRDCTLACIKGGSKYVVVSAGKVYNVENQNYPLLEKFAGQRAEITGDMKGDNITISNIVAPK